MLMSAAETVSDIITLVLIIFYVKYKKEKYNDDPESLKRVELQSSVPRQDPGGIQGKRCQRITCIAFRYLPVKQPNLQGEKGRHKPAHKCIGHIPDRFCGRRSCLEDPD